MKTASTIIITDNNLDSVFCDELKHKYDHNILVKKEVGIDSEMIVQLVITLSGIVTGEIIKIIASWISEKIKERKNRKFQKPYKQELKLIYPDGKTIILVRSQDLDEISLNNIEEFLREIETLLEELQIGR